MRPAQQHRRADRQWRCGDSAVSTGAEALEALRSRPIDCMVLDLGLPDMTGFALIERIRKEQDLVELPIVIYTGKDLTKKQETELRRIADSIIVKDVKSPERLLDETTLFLHRVQANLPSRRSRCWIRRGWPIRCWRAKRC